MKIIIERWQYKGMAKALVNSKQVGIMTFSLAGPELIIIDHTQVEPELNGKGLGKKMLFKIVEMARKENIKIIPLCPYASAMFKKTQEIRDVLKV